MRRLLIAICCVSILFACSKDRELANRNEMNGIWKITNIAYSSKVTIPFLGNLPISGVWKKANYIAFISKGNEAYIDIYFQTDSIRLQGIAIPGPVVEIRGGGTFVETKSAITITMDEGGKNIIIDKSKVKKSTMTFDATTDVKMNFSLGAGLPIPPIAVTATFNMDMDAEKIRP